MTFTLDKTAKQIFLFLAEKSTQIKGGTKNPPDEQPCLLQQNMGKRAHFGNLEIFGENERNFVIW